MRIDVEFSSLGATLRGWLFQPDIELAPAIIMAHGFSATRSMTIDKYAEAFYAAGFTVLLYDHRGFGASDGTPPRQVNPWVQTRGYLDALAFVSKLDGVDPDHIAVWGDSLSAGAVCVAAAIDERIGAVVAQVPAFGASPPPADPDGKLFQTLESMVLSSDVLGFGGPVQGPLPVVSSDQIRHPSALKPLTAFCWFVEHGGRLDSNWVNDVTLALGEWQPGICGPHLHQPVLMLVSPQDEMARANPQVARAVFDSIRGPKEWYEIAGGHFGLLYHPSDLFSEACAAQMSFLRRWNTHGVPADTKFKSSTGPKAQEQPGFRSMDSQARGPKAASYTDV
jgi:hypothetical protein